MKTQPIKIELDSIARDLDVVVSRLNFAAGLKLHSRRDSILFGHAEAFSRSALEQLREAIRTLDGR
jgi:hypothetical protein